MTDKFILESSYEIIHKVGGVNTVVRSKAPECVREYKSNYLMCGPYIPSDDQYATYFDDLRSKTPVWDKLLAEFEEFVECPAGSIKYGRWLVPGEPRCVLLPVALPGAVLQGLRQKAVDILNRKLNVNLFEIREVGEQYKNNAISFGVLQWCFMSFFVPEFIEKMGSKPTLVVQVQEWMAAIGSILFSEGTAHAHLDKKPGYWSADSIRFVFTTHATTIGRHLSAGGLNLLDCFKNPDSNAFADDQAVLRQIAFEHRAERCITHIADILTTVSDITAVECEKFLGRKPDVITWNGLDTNSQKGLIDDHELQSTHKTMKKKIMDFIQTYFWGIDVDNCQILFTAGRNEFKNKGLDLYIDALAKLRNILDDPEFQKRNIEMSKKTIVAFIVAPEPHNGPTQHALNCGNLLREVMLSIDSMTENLKQKLMKKMCQPGSLSELKLCDMVDAQDQITLKRFQQQLQKTGQYCPITTHSIVNETCEILEALRRNGLVNQPFTHVKVVFVPEFLSKTSIFGLDYQEFVRGAHLGIFASAYEPFGYTSPECMCVGTASVVSDLCGCGNLFDSISSQLTQETPNIIGKMEQMHRIASQQIIGQSEHTVIQKRAQKNNWAKNQLGVEVIRRIGCSYDQQVDQLTTVMMDYLQLSMFDRIALRNRMARNCVIVDWSVQAKEYFKAYDLAIQK